mmetsp:Transcript_33631/g.57015  ORF Transcript_33631/g.57015 Transcript_33631/m.57015 type:complete len:121 (-) Transcript_33631:887-1249(-)
MLLEIYMTDVLLAVQFIPPRSSYSVFMRFLVEHVFQLSGTYRLLSLWWHWCRHRRMDLIDSKRLEERKCVFRVYLSREINKKGKKQNELQKEKGDIEGCFAQLLVFPADPIPNSTPYKEN